MEVARLPVHGMPLYWDHHTFWGVQENPTQLYICNQACVCHYGFGKEPYGPTFTDGTYEGLEYEREITFFYGSLASVPTMTPDVPHVELSDLGMQCEPCGPDLELYNMIRGRLSHS